MLPCADCVCSGPRARLAVDLVISIPSSSSQCFCGIVLPCSTDCITVCSRPGNREAASSGLAKIGPLSAYHINSYTFLFQLGWHA